MFGCVCVQVTTDLLTRGGKDIAFSDYSPLWKSHRRLVHNSFTLFGEGSSRLQDIGTDQQSIIIQIHSLADQSIEREITTHNTPSLHLVVLVLTCLAIIQHINSFLLHRLQNLSTVIDLLLLCYI